MTNLVILSIEDRPAERRPAETPLCLESRLIEPVLDQEYPPQL